MSEPDVAPWRRWIVAGVSAWLAAGACAHGPDPYRWRTPGTPPGIELPATTEAVPAPPPWDGVGYRCGVVSVSHPLAAQAGADVLARGGNAIDAAAAIQFMLNVVEPQFSGIGGGGFMMVHLARSQRTFAIDGREKAPAAATPTQFVLSGVPAAQRFAIASTSGLAVGVPGTLAAVDTALRRWGTIPLARPSDRPRRWPRRASASTASWPPTSPRTVGARASSRRPRRCSGRTACR